MLIRFVPDAYAVRAQLHEPTPAMWILLTVHLCAGRQRVLAIPSSAQLLQAGPLQQLSQSAQPSTARPASQVCLFDPC
jgi:hypothetical protein